MNDADAGFFFLGQRPGCNVAMVMLGILEREISFDAMLEELRAAGEEVPRFKDFLSQAPLGLAPPIWLPKPGFDVGEQIHRTSTPSGASWDEALAIVDAFQQAPFPPGKPPWEILLFEGLPEGRALFAMKVHHALSDGTALSLLFANAFGGDFLDKSGLRVVAETEDPPSASRLRVALGDRAGAIRSWLGRAGRELPKLVADRAGRRRELEALGRLVRPAHRVPSASHGPARRLSGFRIPAGIWDSEAKRRGGSANDLYLAVVANVVRGHFAGWDLDAMPLQIVMPVNVRDASAVQHGGNVTGVSVVELTGRSGDLRDLGEVRQQTRKAKRRAGDAEPTLVEEFVQLLPGRLRSLLHFREFATRDVVATNVPMPIPGELCGVPFEMMFMVAPAIGASMSFSLTSYGDHYYLAVNADTEVTPEPLDNRLSETLGEVFGKRHENLRGENTGTSSTPVRA